MLTVVTGWSPSGWKEYAYRFAHTFAMYWPADVRCIAYVEERTIVPDRIEQRLLSDIPGCMEFIERYRNDPRANGRQPTERWKDKERAKGYSYKWDAWKFSRQGFIPWHAAQTVKEGLMCWLDADVVTFKTVPTGFVESLLPADRDLAYLGRGAKHSEIGFQLYRLPNAYPMLRTFSDYYSMGCVFGLPEWHSAYVFDAARSGAEINAHNLTPDGTGHVWFQSPLGKFLDHAKGDRKKIGYSRERMRA